jgi:hypothetical protein
LLSSPPEPTVLELIKRDVAPVAASTSPLVSQNSRSNPWLTFGSAAFLVSVPVFLEAPLVRNFPEISLATSLGWASLSMLLYRNARTRLWGDILVGFTWTWLCGSIFWGWWRWEPSWHLPIEALCLPIALLLLRRRTATVGQYFYLGSLLGTTITDIYFYLVDLMPAWRQLMRVEPLDAGVVFHAALLQMYTPWGLGCAIGLASLLFTIGIYSFTQKSPEWVAFSGAVLSTILVDGLFWLAATLA